LVIGLSYEGPNQFYTQTITQNGASWLEGAGSANNYLPGNNTNYDRAEVWYANNIALPGTVININYNGPINNLMVTVVEYSGLVTALPMLDQGAQAACNVGCGNVLSSGATATTTQVNELLVAAFAQHGVATFSLPTNGFTIEQQASVGTVSGAYSDNSSVIDEVVSTNVTSTLTNNWCGCVATFFYVPVIPPVPPPPPPVPPLPPPIPPQPAPNPALFPVSRTVQDYINHIRDKFAEINFTTWVSNNDLIEWLNLAVEDIAMKTLPPRYEVWPPLQFNSVGQQFNYQLPDNFFRFKSFGDTSGVYFNGDPLLLEDKTAEMEEYVYATLLVTNQPIWFWMWANQLFVYPPPVDNMGIFHLYYYRLPNLVQFLTDLVDVDRPWEEVVVTYVCWKALERDKHPMAQIYRQEYNEAVSTQYSESRVRMEKRARYVHSHDYWGREDR
jgi:hypothetical protein